tara:strand:+ start:858 stop:1601 length:744 start_codon:yes stop_codon:yes gene_type:complete
MLAAAIHTAMEVVNVVPQDQIMVGGALVAIGVMAAVGLVTDLAVTLIANKKTPSEEAREKRMKKFRKQIEAGKTGLDQQTKEQLVDVQRNVNQAVSREFFSKEGELAALQGLSGGDLQAQRLAAEDAAVRREQGIGQVVAQADAVERARQLAAAEGDALKQEAVEAQRRANWVKFGGSVAETATAAVGAGFQLPDAALAGTNLSGIGGVDARTYSSASGMENFFASMTPAQQAELQALMAQQTGGIE